MAALSLILFTLTPVPQLWNCLPSPLKALKRKGEAMRCSTGLLDEVLHPKQEGQAMAMLVSQVPVPIMPLLEALPRPPHRRARIRIKGFLFNGFGIRSYGVGNSFTI